MFWQCCTQTGLGCHSQESGRNQYEPDFQTLQQEGAIAEPRPRLFPGHSPNPHSKCPEEGSSSTQLPQGTQPLCPGSQLTRCSSEHPSLRLVTWQHPRPLGDFLVSTHRSELDWPEPIRRGHLLYTHLPGPSLSALCLLRHLIKASSSTELEKVDELQI